MKNILLILSLFFCLSLSGQEHKIKLVNHKSELIAGKTVITASPMPVVYKDMVILLSTADLLAKDMLFSDPRIKKTAQEKADSVLIKQIHEGYLPKLNAKVTLDGDYPKVVAKGRNKAIQDAEKLAGINYPMHFVWLDGASKAKGIITFKDDNINKVYTVKGTYEAPVITFLTEQKAGQTLVRPYYTRENGNILVFMDGFSGAGTSGDPYRIWTWAGLDSMRYALSSYYILMQNLSSATTGYSTYAATTANTNQGWDPIGDVTTTFTGNFNGQGHTISNIYISRANQEHNGLFGYAEVSNIRNVGVVSITISAAGDMCGGFIGRSQGATITNCYSTGTISDLGDYHAGFAGSAYSSSIITNCYSSCSVASNSSYYYIGGFVGYPQSVTITNSYSVGSVANGAAGWYGGFAGSNNGTVTNCFWDTQTSGQSTSPKGTGKTTAEMKTLSTFTDASWSIATIAGWTTEAWYIDATVDYPRLGWEHTAAPSSNVKSFNGVLRANVKSFNGVAIGSVKSINGIL